MFEIELTPKAEQAYTHLEAVTRARVDRVFEQFEQEISAIPTFELYAASLRAACVTVWASGALSSAWITLTRRSGLKR